MCLIILFLLFLSVFGRQLFTIQHLFYHVSKLPYFPTLLEWAIMSSSRIPLGCCGKSTVVELNGQVCYLCMKGLL
jgi:hypothetical protein